MVDKTLKDVAALAAEHIRQMSAEGKLTRYEYFYSEPLSLTCEEVEKAIEQFKEDENYDDIKKIEASSEVFLYSNKKMTLNYAKLLVRIEGKDLLKLVAETVREESKTYPRPTDVRLFSTHPFSFTKDEFYRVLEEMSVREEYKDIGQVKASNDAVYLYSTRFLTEDYASSLAEWIEIGQYDNP